jgi:hypothetical protein
MSSRLIVPFDNNPALTDIQYLSYTVPALKFSKVIAAPTGGWVLLNNKPLAASIVSAFTIVSNATNTTTSFITRYTNPSNRYFKNVTLNFTNTDGSGGSGTYTFRVYDGTTVKWQSTASLSQSQSAVRTIPFIAPGDLVQISVNSNTYSSNSFNLVANPFEDQPSEFWAKAGDVIEASGTTSSGISMVLNINEYNALS